MSIKRPFIIHDRPNNQRLHFPVPGDFGYEDLVGRKKYDAKRSAIHRIIFNHDIDSTVSRKSQDTKRQLQPPSLNPENNSILSNVSAQSRVSPITGLSIGHYQTSQRRSGGSSRGLKRPHLQYLPKNHSQMYAPRQRGRLSPYYSSQDHEGDTNILEGYILAKESQGQHRDSKDSLDLLLNPGKLYDSRTPKKETQLDSIIRHRRRNPTFLNSQL